MSMERHDIEGWRESLAHLWLVAVGPRRDARYEELVLPGYGNILSYLADMAGMSQDQLNGEIRGWSEQTVTARWIELRLPVWDIVRAEADKRWWIAERRKLWGHKRKQK